jgi:predicted dehydrogenase
MVGFNRRFAPQVQKINALLAGIREPKSFVMTVNAGAIPAEHWTQDPEVGGGRIIGEACHFIDMLRFLAGSPILSVQGAALGTQGQGMRADEVSFTLCFADGSMGTVHYLSLDEIRGAIEELGFTPRQRNVHYQLLDPAHEARAIEANHARYQQIRARASERERGGSVAARSTGNPLNNLPVVPLTIVRGDNTA